MDSLPTLPSYDLTIPAGQSKLCLHCKTSKPISEFGFFKEKRASGSIREYLNTYCKPCAREKAKLWYRANQKHVSASAKNRRLAGLEKIIEAYGGKCACCGESSPKFLTIDHKNNDGFAHRNQGFVSQKLYLWIIQKGFPDDLQLLCWNCNCGKQRNGGVCPHNTI